MIFYIFTRRVSRDGRIVTKHLTYARLDSLLIGLVLITYSEPAIAFPLFTMSYEFSSQTVSNRTLDNTPPSFRRPPIADGIVDRYLLHPLGDVEGLLLRDGSQVHVTARAAHELVSTIQPGDHVQVHGRRPSQLPIVQPDVIVNVTDGRSLTVPLRLDRPIPPAEERKTLNEMKASGTIQVLLYDHLKGTVNGIVLSDGTQVRLPPDVGERFHLSLQYDLDVEVQGYGTQTQYGRSLRATAIGRKGKPLTYLDASIQQLP